MNKLNLITLALGCAFSAGALAQNLSKSEYKAAKDYCMDQARTLHGKL
ncbi:MAG: hypothetical protein HY066_14865 [Betaproteobacteria bacterium]|nr:hypothetical protein [Betaproteobacteria bacterium]